MNLGAKTDNVCLEIDPKNNEERKLEEKYLQKIKENEPTEKVESGLITDENYESRLEATELTKQFFRNNLEDSDCRTFITTRGEVIKDHIYNLNIYFNVFIWDYL